MSGEEWLGDCPSCGNGYDALYPTAKLCVRVSPCGCVVGWEEGLGQ